MANNGKALLASAIAGLMVIGVAYWWNRRDDTPDDRGVHHRGRHGVRRKGRLDG